MITEINKIKNLGVFVENVDVTSGIVKTIFILGKIN
jgi:hypothetical protein